MSACRSRPAAGPPREGSTVTKDDVRAALDAAIAAGKQAETEIGTAGPVLLEYRDACHALAAAARALLSAMDAEDYADDDARRRPLGEPPYDR